MFSLQTSDYHHFIDETIYSANMGTRKPALCQMAHLYWMFSGVLLECSLEKGHNDEYYSHLPLYF